MTNERLQALRQQVARLTQLDPPATYLERVELRKAQAEILAILASRRTEGDVSHP